MYEHKNIINLSYQPTTILFNNHIANNNYGHAANSFLSALINMLDRPG